MVDRESSTKAEREGYWISQRRPDRTYVSKTFEHNRPYSSDNGQPARFISKVFDVEHETEIDADAETWTVRRSAAGRVQVKLLVVRTQGHIKQLLVHRVRRGKRLPLTAEVLLDLQGDDARRLVELLRNLEHIPVDGSETVRVDDALIRDIFSDPQSLLQLYRREPVRFRQLITDDQAARDVVAVAWRRAQVERFERLLVDDEYFDEECEQHAGPEAVWQAFFEANPWIFGCTLAGQFLTSWSPERLEQVVSGSSIASTMKRADAVMRTAGRIRSMVFAEIKTHRTQLLQTTRDAYRPGCWAPHADLAGAVAQVQGTVQLATQEIGTRITRLDSEGAEIFGDVTYLFQPRSFLVIGNLDQLTGALGDHVGRVRSFELYRRHLSRPEVLTFDEVLARARWLVDSAYA